ncbi:MAG: hypothetical protein EZS28_007940 [Streblomastix strix]|uniref:Uncharacterized protein n=1 Tax=Streblomastix strix TaxID=222440 RepID=A0A5J4WNL2_9EUKA|nr:MAG: hypothetical protein EZS28_007940 [Streblomastix strix]
MDQLENDHEEDEYDSDAELQALNDQSVAGYEIGIDIRGFGAVKTNFVYFCYCWCYIYYIQAFVSEDKGYDRGVNDGKSGDFGGGNGFEYLSESDEVEDDMEFLLSNA